MSALGGMARVGRSPIAEQALSRSVARCGASPAGQARGSTSFAYRGAPARRSSWATNARRDDELPRQLNLTAVAACSVQPIWTGSQPTVTLDGACLPTGGFAGLTVEGQPASSGDHLGWQGRRCDGAVRVHSLLRGRDRRAGVRDVLLGFRGHERSVIRAAGPQTARTLTCRSFWRSRLRSSGSDVRTAPERQMLAIAARARASRDSRHSLRASGGRSTPAR